MQRRAFAVVSFSLKFRCAHCLVSYVKSRFFLYSLIWPIGSDIEPHTIESMDMILASVQWLIKHKNKESNW